jgi:Aldehyde dehydrogenase family
LDRTDWNAKMQVRNTEAPIVEDMFIDGKSVDGRERIEVRNPARPEELVGTIVRGTPDHVDQAVAAAKSAQPAWAALSFVQRADVLRRALARLESEIDRRAAVFVRENGKPLAQARGELLSVPKRQLTALDYAPQFDAERTYTAANGRTFVVSRPYGVVVDCALEFARRAGLHADRCCSGGRELRGPQAAGKLSTYAHSIGADVCRRTAAGRNQRRDRPAVGNR